MRAFVLLCLLPLSASATEYSFSGYARHPDTGALLYIETHQVRGGGTPGETRQVSYRRDENSPPFALKSLRYGAERERPEFEFSDQRSGFAESVRRDARGFRVTSRAGAKGRLRSAALDETDVAVIDAGFDEFVRNRWDALQAGESIDARFLVPSRLDAVEFRLRRTGAASIDGEPVTVIRLSLASPLGWFLPDIEVSYRDRDRRLMRYRGLTNIRDARGGLLAAQIDFPDAGVTGR